MAEDNILVRGGTALRSCRGRRAWHAGTGVLQEPGRSYRFRLEGPGGEAGDQSPGPCRVAFAPAWERRSERGAVTEGEKETRGEER